MYILLQLKGLWQTPQKAFARPEAARSGLQPFRAHVHPLGG
jgi:hypothetical protein